MARTRREYLVTAAVAASTQTAALQQVWNQRVLTPRTAYNYGLATAAGFLAVNGVVQAYEESSGIGTGVADQDKVTPSTGGDLAFKVANDFEAPDGADADGDYELAVLGFDAGDVARAEPVDPPAARIVLFYAGTALRNAVNPQRPLLDPGAAAR